MAASSTPFDIWTRAAGTGLPTVCPLAIQSPRLAACAPSRITRAPIFPWGHSRLYARPGVPDKHRGCVEGGAEWLAYAREQPVLDNGFASFTTHRGALQRVGGSATHPVDVRGLRHLDILDERFQLGCSSAYRVSAELELDSQKHCVLEDLITQSCESGSDVASGIPSFEDRRRVVRANESKTQSGIFGDSARAALDRSGREVRFKLVDLRGRPGANPLSADGGSDGNVGVFDVQRNTFVGRALVRDIGADDGPLRLDHNVILGDDAGDAEHVHLSTSATGRVEASDNLTGALAEGIADTNGELQGGLSHLGQPRPLRARARSAPSPITTRRHP